MNSIKIKKVETKGELDLIYDLRKEVYVVKEKRIDSVDSFLGSFDKYDKFATYFLIYNDTKVIGCFKLIQDSDIGLPCQEAANNVNVANDVRVIRQKYKCVEIGHFLINLSEKSTAIIKYVFKYIFEYARKELGVNYLIGDIFYDGNHWNFYQKIGFTIIYGPYDDNRFIGTPKSLIIGLDLTQLNQKLEMLKEKNRKFIDYILQE